MTTTVLFLCPHAAGKSILGATYLRAAGARLGVDVTVTTAGTDPDAEVMPIVRSALTTQGFVVDMQPRLVNQVDTADADIIISIGCEHTEVPTDKSIIEWNVPLLSEDFSGAVQVIHTKAEQFARTLLRASQSGPTPDEAQA